MNLVPYVAPLLVAAILCSVFIVVAAPQRAVPGVRWFAVFMGTLVVWTLGYAAEIVLPGVEAKVLAAKVQYLGIVVVGFSWLGFTTEYTGLSWWSRRNMALGLVIPVAVLALVWSNEAHGLAWTSVALTTGHAYTVLDIGRGPVFWLLVAYSYACLLVALGLLARVVLIRPAIFRGQARTLLVASVLPWIGNAIYVTGAWGTDLDLTVFGFAVSGFLAGWAVLRWKFLSIGPIARDTIVEGMSEAVAVIDVEGRVVDVNPAALRILGADPDRVVGWSAAEALGRFAPDLDPAAPSRRTVKGLAEERSYDCQLNPLRDARGAHRGWTLVLHDVTERAEEADALRRAREAAEDMAAAQRAFLANMNHELRTPLNGVMGMLQVLMQSELNGEQRGYADLAYASSQELLALLDRILEFSALEMGKLELAEAPFDLASVVRRSLEGVAGAASRKGLGLRLETGPDLPPRLLGDATRMGQVLAGLLDNAVKFTDRGGVEVRLGVVGRTDDAVRVRVDVSDTGIGIPGERLDAIFQGFVQADGSSTRRHEGAGLGLTIAHRLVTRMGGELRVSSQPGKGSTFWCEIPFKTAA